MHNFTQTKHLLSYKNKNTFFNICEQKHFAWLFSREGEIFPIAVPKCGADNTCKVAAGSLIVAESASVIVTLLEGNHYTRRSEVMSSIPTRYNICTKIKRTNSIITSSLAYCMQGTTVTKQVETPDQQTNINKD